MTERGCRIYFTIWYQLVDGLKIGYKLTENNMTFPLDRYDVMLEFDPSVLTHETYGRSKQATP